MNTKKLTIDSMLAAMCAVLGFIAIDTGAVKITFESLPILLGALLFGPVDGAVIGGIGTLISQLLKYGVSMTTTLWMAPYIICGIMVGAHAKNNHFNLTKTKLTTVVVSNELLITMLNTVVLYVDSKIYGYFTPAYIYGSLALRIGICIVKAIAYSFVLPPIIAAVKKSFKD